MSNAKAYIKKLIKSNRDIHTIYYHCSDSPYKKHDKIEQMRSWHVEEKGFQDVGYQYYIKFNGTIQTGRSVHIQPASQYPKNHGTLSICLSGADMNDPKFNQKFAKSDFTEQQKESLKILSYALRDLYGKQLKFRGHIEVDGRPCPVFPYKEWLNIDSNGILQDEDIDESSDTWFTAHADKKFNFIEKAFNKVGLA